MFRVEWTAQEVKPPAELDALFEELQESIGIDGHCEFPVLCCAVRALEDWLSVARIIGFDDRDLVLGDADVIELLGGAAATIEALACARPGLIELYPDPGADYIVFDTGPEEVRLYRVPWTEAGTIDLQAPLPTHLNAYPMTTCGRTELIEHLQDLCRTFARTAITNDPRLASHEPLRRWSSTGPARASGPSTPNLPPESDQRP